LFPFLLFWLIKICQYEYNGNAYSLQIAGPIQRAAVNFMYKDSTPEIRLERKYNRLKHLLEPAQNTSLIPVEST
jgi:hypothetical protein